MNIIDNIKSVAKIIQKADNIELYQKILDVQAEALEVVEENNKLREENGKLKEKLEIKKKLKYKDNAYWIESTDKKEGEKDEPFCSRCWDVDKNLVRLHPCGNPAFYNCPNCKSGSIKVKPALDTSPFHTPHNANRNDFR